MNDKVMIAANDNVLYNSARMPPDPIPAAYLPATITASEPYSGCQYWSDDYDDKPGREYKLVSSGGDVFSLIIAPSSGGYVHGGVFDADGDWPEVGDTIFAVEETYGDVMPDDGNQYEYSVVRIISSKGDMRAMVRDYDDPYDYGAGLRVEFKLLDRS